MREKKTTRVASRCPKILEIFKKNFRIGGYCVGVFLIFQICHTGKQSLLTGAFISW